MVSVVVTKRRVYFQVSLQSYLILRYGPMIEGRTRGLCDKINEKVDTYASVDLKLDAVSLLWEISRRGG
jgi:hypothetical protein